MQIQEFLLAQATAGTADGGSGSGDASPAVPAGGTQAGDGEACPLAALLRQTEVGEQELRALLAQEREHIGAAQRRAAVEGLQRARGGQHLRCELPPGVSEVLAGRLPRGDAEPPQTGHNQEEKEQGAAGVPAVKQAQRLAQQLHELAWAAGSGFGASQRSMVEMVQSSRVLRAIHESSPRLLGQAVQPSIRIKLPDPRSLEVLPECPGDLQLLAQAGSAADTQPTPDPTAQLLGTLEGLLRREESEAGAGGAAGVKETDPAFGATNDAAADDAAAGPSTSSSGRAGGSGLAHSSGPAAAGNPPSKADLLSKLPGRDGPLLLLEESLDAYASSGWVLEALLGEEGPEFSDLVLSSLNGPSLPQLAGRRLLCSLLLGQALLELLEEQAAAAEAAAAAGQPDAGPPEALVGRLGRLTAACIVNHTSHDPSRIVDALEESPREAMALKAMLATLERVPVHARAGLSYMQSLLFMEVEVLTYPMRALGQDSTPVARNFIAQARRRLCRSILQGLQALQQARCLVPSLLTTLSRFVRLALLGADGDSSSSSSEDGSGSPCSSGNGGAAGPAGTGPEGGDSAVLARIGLLPLRHLAELHSFVCMLLGGSTSSPGPFLPALQEAMVHCCMPAEVTPKGAVRLTAAGLQVLSQDVEAIEAFRDGRDAPEAATHPPLRRLLVAAVEGGGCSTIEAAAGLLAGYSCGVSHAETEIARRVTAAGVEAHVQDLPAAPATMMLLGAQGMICIHKLLAGAAASARQALKDTAALLEELKGVLGPLGEAAAQRGPLEAAFSRHLSARLTALVEHLDGQLESSNTAAQAACEAQVGLKNEFMQYEQRILVQESKRANAQAELLLPTPHKREQVNERRQKLAQRLAEVAQEVEMSGMGLLAGPGLSGREKEAVRLAKQLAQVLARQLETAGDADESHGPRLQDAVLSQLQGVRDLLSKQARSLEKTSGFLQVVADRAAAQAEVCIGELVYTHSLRPSLEPAFRALTRHLLGPKWEAELAAQQAAEEEARRQAALQALLQEEEEEGGSAAAAQAKQGQKRAKKKAKKAASKAAGQEQAREQAAAAEPQQQAARQHAKQQDSRQGKQQAGLQRLLQQMQEDEEHQEQEEEEQQHHQQQQQQQQTGSPHPGENGAPLAAPTPAPQAGQTAKQQQAAQAASEQQQAGKPRPKQHAASAVPGGGRKKGGQAAGKQPVSSAAPATAAAPAAPAVEREQQQAEAAAGERPPSQEPEQHSQRTEQQVAAEPAIRVQQAEEEGGWQQAASSHRRGGRAGKGANGLSAAPPQPLPAAIVGWEGRWRCSCGNVVPPRTNCRECGELNPCREYVFEGGCSRGGAPHCMFPHPPFDLPRGPRPPAGRGIVAPPAGVPLHGCMPPPSVARLGSRAAAAPQVAAALLSGGSSGHPGWQDKPAALPEPAAEAVSPPSPAGGEDAELAALLGMMGLDSEEQGAAAAAAAAAPPTGTSWGPPLAPPAAGTSWAQRASAGLGGEADSTSPTAAAAAAAAWPVPGQSQEDTELEAAIQASLAEAAAAAVGSPLRPSSRGPAAGEAPAPVPAAADGGLGLAGLRNEAGEYNCFLNVIIQCLWRCADFRQQVASWDAAFCGADPVVGCLHDLFQQFQRQEQHRRSGGGEDASTSGLSPVDPTPLREALAVLPGQKFRMGEMNDAAEVLLSIYERVIEAASQMGLPAGIEPTFGLSVREEVHCSHCGKDTHQTSYTQYFYNTQATVLHMLRGAYGDSLSTGQLLREAEAQHHKSCDKDMGGCGRPCPVNHFLLRAPRVFTLQLAWESHSEQSADIAATLAAIDEEVDLGEVYQGAEPGAHRYRLRSMVCYYGQHYQALVLVPEAGGWLMFDDTRVARVGGWEAVRRKCEAGRIQPSMLFYEAA
ncbi:hypothetical protein ABPG75_000237 [Micractinium tetrahymenae]